MVDYRGMMGQAVAAADTQGSVDTVEKPMDMRTIRQLLEDERTLALTLPISRYRLQFEAMAGLRMHFLPVATDTSLSIYKPATQEEMVLRATHCPQTADDFYALAMAIRQQKHYTAHGEFQVLQHGAPASAAALKAFSYHLLNDAAKAGHPQSGSVLVEDAMQGTADARKYVTLKEFVIGGMSIHLPRQLTSSEEIRKLGSDLLIQFRRQLCIDGQALSGPYYKLPNGKDAEKLSRHLLKLAETRRQEEARAQISRKYDEQRLKTSGVNGLFGTVVEAVTQSANALVADSLVILPAR